MGTPKVIKNSSSDSRPFGHSLDRAGSGSIGTSGIWDGHTGGSLRASCSCCGKSAGPTTVSRSNGMAGSFGSGLEICRRTIQAQRRADFPWRPLLKAHHPHRSNAPQTVAARNNHAPDLPWYLRMYRSAPSKKRSRTTSRSASPLLPPMCVTTKSGAQ